MPTPTRSSARGLHRRGRPWAVVSVLVLFPMASPAGSGPVSGPALHLEKQGTPLVYFTYGDRPLLSLGGLSDFVFYGGPDAYDLERWADWAEEHGINHIRAYPPLSWKHVES